MHFDAVCLLGNALRRASIYVYQSYDRWNHHLFVLSTGESSNRSSRPRHNRPPRRVKFRLFPQTRKRTARFLFFLFVFLLLVGQESKRTLFLILSFDFLILFFLSTRMFALDSTEGKIRNWIVDWRKGTRSSETHKRLKRFLVLLFLSTERGKRLGNFGVSCGGEKRRV